MSSADVAVIIGGALAGFVALAVVVSMRRTRSRPKTVARKPIGGETRTFDDRTTGGSRAYRAGRVQDRRSLWARRYGAGGAWTAAAWTAGTGLHLQQNRDGVGDPVAGCSGSPGVVGGALRRRWSVRWRRRLQRRRWLRRWLRRRRRQLMPASHQPEVPLGADEPGHVHPVGARRDIPVMRPQQR